MYVGTKHAIEAEWRMFATQNQNVIGSGKAIIGTKAGLLLIEPYEQIPLIF